jgi:hypothetical protein
MLHHANAEHLCSNAGGIVRTMRSMVENIRRWLTGIGAAFKNPTEYFSRPIAAETRGESAAAEAGADATATESAVATPTTVAAFTTPVTADGKIGQDVQVSCVVPIRPNQQEIQGGWNWSGRCSTISGADAMTSRRHSWIGWTRPNLI